MAGSMIAASTLSTSSAFSTQGWAKAMEQTKNEANHDWKYFGRIVDNAHHLVSTTGLLSGRLSQQEGLEDNMTKYQLMALLFQSSKTQASIPVGKLNGTNSDFQCYIEAIEREDGSGSSFNVRVRLLGNEQPTTTIHIRTVD